MNRCEAVSYLQNLRHLEDGRFDLQILTGLGESRSSRIGSMRSMDSHSDDMVLQNYWFVKDKMRGGIVNASQSRARI